MRVCERFQEFSRKQRVYESSRFHPPGRAEETGPRYARRTGFKIPREGRRSRLVCLGTSLYMRAASSALWMRTNTTQKLLLRSERSGTIASHACGARQTYIPVNI